MTRDFHILPDREIVKGILTKYRERIQGEIYSAKNLMALLMKGTYGKWTQSELVEIKAHLLHLSKNIPVLMVFLLPGGLILLPILVETLDRRKKNFSIPQDRRNVVEKEEGRSPYGTY